jgi:S1-C subfamily serine protease
MNRKITLSVAGIIVSIALVACSFTSLFSTPTPVAPTAVTIPTLPVSSAPQDISAQQSQFTAIYTQINPGVVSIRTSSDQGSGWVYSGDGYIVTNDHVVNGEATVEVDFASGLKTSGKVVGTDAYSDLAVIKVDVTAAELHPLPLGDSSPLQVGQTVIAIGNPFGLSGTMTTGIISALGRSLPSSEQVESGGYFSTADVIQTDTALNPGNSGGPLLDMNGQVIGINSDIVPSTTTITSGQATNSGIGFAISINTIKKVVPSLIQTGKYTYPYLGISTLADEYLSLDVINALGLTKTAGAYVMSVASGGPADRAGILGGTQPVTLQGFTGLNKGGDLIIAIDGHPVLSYDDMIRYLDLNKAPGDTVTLTVLRGDQQKDIPIVLGTRP